PERRAARPVVRGEASDGVVAGVAAADWTSARVPREYLRDYLSVDDLGPAELLHLLDVADALKADRTLQQDALAGMTVALLFEKASTRTRVSFEVGIGQLGGRPL